MADEAVPLSYEVDLDELDSEGATFAIAPSTEKHVTVTLGRDEWISMGRPGSIVVTVVGP